MTFHKLAEGCFRFYFSIYWLTDCAVCPSFTTHIFSFLSLSSFFCSVFLLDGLPRTYMLYCFNKTICFLFFFSFRFTDGSSKQYGDNREHSHHSRCSGCTGSACSSDLTGCLLHQHTPHSGSTILPHAGEKNKFMHPAESAVYLFIYFFFLFKDIPHAHSCLSAAWPLATTVCCS